MIALIQRVTEASVAVGNVTIGRIGCGIMALIGVQKHDSEQSVTRMAEKLLNYRIFSDDQGKMNLSLLHVQGELLLVPQFTLPADTSKGLRPSFSTAASPELGKRLFDELIDNCRESALKVENGQFAADMQVTLCNNGPVTFWLETG